MIDHPSPDTVHKVGYKNPPQHTRFKKGQSGNPSGKKKKTKKSFGELVKAVAKETIAVTQPNGIVKQMSLLEAAIYATIAGPGQSATKTLTAVALLEKYFDPDAIAPTEDERPVFKENGKVYYRLLLTQDDIDAFNGLQVLCSKYDGYEE